MRRRPSARRRVLLERRPLPRSACDRDRTQRRPARFHRGVGLAPKGPRTRYPELPGSRISDHPRAGQSDPSALTVRERRLKRASHHSRPLGSHVVACCRAVTDTTDGSPPDLRRQGTRNRAADSYAAKMGASLTAPSTAPNTCRSATPANRRRPSMARPRGRGSTGPGTRVSPAARTVIPFARPLLSRRMATAT